MSFRETSFLAQRAFGLVKPALDRLPPETAHHLTIALLSFWKPHHPPPRYEILKTRLWNRDFSSPIGLAAGFDKNGRVFDKMLALGMGFVEIGTMTPKPQKGNAKPRLFALREQGALLNRLGFNNQGLDAIIKQIGKKPLEHVGINIGANANSVDYKADYYLALKALSHLNPAYIALNISSPNTLGLRQLERLDRLASLLDGLPPHPRLLIKLSPDLDDDAYRDIAHLALERKIAGLIATNTTINHSHQKGGLSGLPLYGKTRHIIKQLYSVLKGQIPIIGVGGIHSGESAYHFIRDGAHMVQLYTALVWHGPNLVQRIHQDLARKLEEDGFSSVAQAVGSDYNKPIKG